MKKELSDKEKRKAMKKSGLHFASDQGIRYKEYIPPVNSEFTNWFRTMHYKARVFLGKDIYYWHIRHWFGPIGRKQEDIEFLYHVLKTHGGKPVEPVEKRHFNRAFRHYGNEFAYVMSQVSKEENNKSKVNASLEADPQVDLYLKRWLNMAYDADYTVVYHGISRAQYRDLTKLLYEREKQKEDKNRAVP